MKLDPDFMRTVVLFSDLPDEELQMVSDIFKETKYQRGQIVFFEEDTGKYMYIRQEWEGEGFPAPSHWQGDDPGIPPIGRVHRRNGID